MGFDLVSRVRSAFFLVALVLLAGCLGAQSRKGPGDGGGGGGGGGRAQVSGGGRNPQDQNQNPFDQNQRLANQNPFGSFADALNGGNQGFNLDDAFGVSAEGLGNSPGGLNPNEHAEIPSNGRPIAGVTPDAKGLNRSGEGGNPSFSYAVRGYKVGNGVPTPQCQGTLTNKAEGVCTITTAAHCLIDAEDVNNPTPPQSRFPGIAGLDKKTRKVVALTSPDFGSFEALAVLNDTYVSQNNILNVQNNGNGIQIQTTPSSHDIAMLMFKGPACDNNTAQMVSPSRKCEPPNKIEVGSRWKRRTFRADPIGAIIDSIKVSIAGTGIKQGDSGGGLFCFDGDKAVGLMGVLSTGGALNQKNKEGFWNEASYSARSSLDWAMSTDKSLREKGASVALPEKQSKPIDRSLAAR